MDLVEEHLTAETVAAYVDHRLHGAELDRVEEHLAECDPCRQEVVAVTRTLQAPRARAPRYAAFAGLAAAAVVAAVLLFGSGPDELGPPPGPVLRGGDPAQEEGTPAIVALSPPDRAELRPGDVVFGWRSAGSDAFYRLTLTDENGDVLWSAGTADTTLPLPPGTGLRSESLYYWYVDALLPDGGSATTGVHSFGLAP